MIDHVDDCTSDLDTFIRYYKRNIDSLEGNIGRVLQYCRLMRDDELIAAITTASGDGNIAQGCRSTKCVHS